MRPEFYAVIAAVMLGVLPAAAMAEVDCALAETQADINRCAEADWKTEDARLNEAYDRAMTRAGYFDDSLDAADRGAVQALKRAQRAWLAYRDAECDAQSFAVKGGSLEAAYQLFCMANLSKLRSEELETYMGD